MQCTVQESLGSWHIAILIIVLNIDFIRYLRTDLKQYGYKFCAYGHP